MKATNEVHTPDAVVSDWTGLKQMVFPIGRIRKEARMEGNVNGANVL